MLIVTALKAKIRGQNRYTGITAYKSFEFWTHRRIFNIRAILRRVIALLSDAHTMQDGSSFASLSYSAAATAAQDIDLCVPPTFEICRNIMDVTPRWSNIAMQTTTKHTLPT
ncbi:uncharacterized protein RAG0_04436 [Rhynchosporium agropyri]|uniref:Uncharacterized protein n=1 Tax=Rhynchosporium agropyri TaxID=914238 RepID=A0A1E1K8W4_9HELO|nr:uncharacterized protein RAG0_04436 [Rhynchosporium agropyri]